MKNRPDLNECALIKTRQLMNRAVPDCLIEGYESLIEGIHLPDPNDRHVVAAAIRGRADAIITYNLTDFPDEALKACGVEAQHPDVFIADLVDLAPQEVLKAAKDILSRLKNPPVAGGEYLDRLAALNLAQTVKFLRGKIE